MVRPTKLPRKLDDVTETDSFFLSQTDAIGHCNSLATGVVLEDLWEGRGFLHYTGANSPLLGFDDKDKGQSVSEE